MSGFLLGTNVASEILKPSAERWVVVFLTDQPNLWLSVIVLHEMKFGAGLLSVLSALVAKYDD